MSEPPTKIVKLDSVYGPLSQSKMEDAAGVSIFLCSDILLEVLRCLKRRQIIELESTGGRIHRIVKSCLKREPYITRFLELKPGPKDGLVAKISKFGSSSFASISHEELGLFLRSCKFLRFRSVTLNYNDLLYNNDGFQSIDERCQLFVTHLKPLKAAFSDSTKFEFIANIGRAQNYFRDPLQLLNHLHKELLSVCDSARLYEFTVRLLSPEAEASATDILDSILRMPPINASANVQLNLYQPSGILPQLLPVDAISAWLDRSTSNNMIMKCKQQQKTALELSVYLSGVENVHELCEHLKKTFNKAESPRQPFIFTMSPFYGVFQSETLSNEKTGEELSIDQHESPFMISLKRSLKKSKN